MAVTPIGSNWADPDAYAAIAARGRSGLAWELLRRDPAYPAAFAGGRAEQSADSAFTARWGLHFR